MEIKKWLGLNNTTSPERMKPGELAVALDMDIDNTNRLMSRQGRTLIDAQACHSLYSYEGGSFLSRGTSIFAIEQPYSLTLAAVLTSSDPISYDSVAGVAYFSNGFDTGRFVGRTYHPWGVNVPVYQPVPSLTTGNLRAGRYQYALTFLRSDGHESGTGLAGYIDLSATGGIRLTNIEVSTNPEVSDKILYLTSRDGEVLYRVMTVPNSQTTAYITDEPLGGIPLTTQFAGPPPAGTQVVIYNGVAYVVRGDTVFYSDPYAFGLFRPDVNFLQFPGTISLFDWVNDGIYVATSDSEGDGSEGAGTTWFMAGDRPDKFQPKQVFNYGSTPGTSVRVDSGFFGKQVERIGEPALIWTSRHGVCVGNDGGVVHNLTESAYSFPSAQAGAALLRQYRGFVQYMTVQQGTGAANNAYVETL